MSEPLAGGRAVIDAPAPINVSRHIAAQSQPEQLRFWLASIVESSDDAILSKDLNGIITSWNRAAQRIFGYTADEMIGTSILRLIPTELQSEEADILAKLRAGQRIDHFETVRLRQDGERLNVSLTISPSRTPRARSSAPRKFCATSPTASAWSDPSSRQKSWPPAEEWPPPSLTRSTTRLKPCST